MNLHFVGLSGYAYPAWRGEGRLYPTGTKPSEFFDLYASEFRAVEMDGTWYRMPSESAVAGWVAQVTPGFQYTFKVHRSVTHLKRLAEDSMESVEFMLKRLKPALDEGVVGCIYFQFPPNFKRFDDRLERFLARLPQGVPFACEFRHPSWDTDEVEAILRENGVAFVASDDEGRDGVRRDTGSLIYARLRRENYDDAALQLWADYFREKGKSKPVYVFFKHEDDGSPWLEARRLLKLLA